MTPEIQVVATISAAVGFIAAGAAMVWGMYFAVNSATDKMTKKVDELRTELGMFKDKVDVALNEYRRTEMCNLAMTQVERRFQDLEKELEKLNTYAHSRIHEIANKAQIALGERVMAREVQDGNERVKPTRFI